MPDTDPETTNVVEATAEPSRPPKALPAPKVVVCRGFDEAAFWLGAGLGLALAGLVQLISGDPWGAIGLAVVAIAVALLGVWKWDLLAKEFHYE